jgi:homoisocitrate dehydrogenase
MRETPPAAVARVLAIPGDGIGREVVAPTVDLLARFPEVVVEVAEAGYEAWTRTGEAISEAALSALDRVDGVLFGCTATPAPPPDGYSSPILRLRRRLHLYANIRHCRSRVGSPLDVVMVRDCHEGLYSESEREIPGGVVADYRITRVQTRRVAEVAAALAKRRGNVVTVVHKANVLRKADGLFRSVAIEAIEEAGVGWDEALADAAGYHLVNDPSRYDVMVMPSHVGDILSDVAAAVGGGLGLVPSLSLGASIPLAEPIHGSAPDIAGRGVADPSATVLSAAMLLEEMGLGQPADRLRDAVYDHLRDRQGDRAPGTSEAAADIARRLDAIVAAEPAVR